MKYEKLECALKFIAHMQRRYRKVLSPNERRCFEELYELLAQEKDNADHARMQAILPIVIEFE